jgi:hypothetical protein
MKMQTLGLLAAAALTLPAQAFAGERPAAAAEQRLQQMIASGEAYSEDVLKALYDQLEAVPADFMIGVWRGGKFDGGTTPDPINWFGKQFVDRDHVEPLLVRGADGSVQVFDKLGAARLREVKFRGQTGAALIYDKQPIMDYFRRISDDTVLGWGEVKGKDSVLFFYLTRAPQVSVAAAKKSD